MFVQLLSGIYFASDTVNSGNLPTVVNPGSSTIGTILGIIFVIIGAMALLMIVVAGFRYVLSAGDPQKIAQARNAIIYSLVGVVVAITAEAIVHFVVGGI